MRNIEEASSFKTWDQMYYLQQKNAYECSSPEHKPSADDARWAKKFYERVEYLKETDSQFAADLETFYKAGMQKGIVLSSTPETQKINEFKKKMEKIDKAFKATINGDNRTPEQKLLCSHYERQLKENRKKETDNGIKIVNPKIAEQIKANKTSITI